MYKVSNPRRRPIFDLKNLFKLAISGVIVGFIVLLVALAIEAIGLHLIGNLVGFIGIGLIAAGFIALLGHILYAVWTDNFL